MDYIEKIQPIKAKKRTKGNSKNKPSNQKWAVLSISSIPLVMTLGNSMLIPVLPAAMERQLGYITFSSQYDHYRLLDCGDPLQHSTCRILYPTI